MKVCKPLILRMRILALLGILAVLGYGCHDPGTPLAEAPETAILPHEESTGASADTVDPKTVHIKFLCSEPYDEFADLAQQFQQMHPDIRIQIVPLEDVLLPAQWDLTPVEMLHKAVAAADTSILGSVVTREGTRQGLVQDLSPFIESDPDFGRSDFVTGTLEAFEWDGGVWGIPARADLMLLFCDKPTFDEAGVAYPDPAWNRNDFLSTAQQLVVRNGSGEVARYGFANPDTALVPAFVEGISDTYVQDLNGPDMPRLDAPDVVEALKWFTDLAEIYGVMPPQSVITQATIQDGRAIMTWYEAWLKPHRVAMWPGLISQYWHYFDSPWLDYDAGDLGLAPLPFGGRGTAYHQPWGYIMSSGTSHPQESWLWIEYLSRQLPLASPGAMPARRSLVEASDYWSRWGSEERQAIEASLGHLMAVRRGDMMVSELVRAADTVFGGETAAHALDTAQANVLAAYTTLAQMEPVEVEVASDESEDDGVTVVTFEVRRYDPGHTLADLAERFHAEMPDIQVKVTEASSGSTPDCFTDSVAVLRELDTDNTLPLNLQPYIDTEGSPILDELYFVDVFRHKGELYGLPALAQPEVLFYNQELFDAAGLAYPRPNWTPQDFYSAARLLTHDRAGSPHYGFLPLSEAIVDLPLFMAMDHVELWDAQGRPRFDAPDVVEAITWYTALIRETMPAFVMTWDEIARSQRVDLINSGQSAMWTAYLGTGTLPNALPEAANTFRMVPFPGGKARMNYEGLFIRAGTSTEKAQACWEWLRYAVAHRPITPGMGIPALRATLASDGFRAQAGPGVMASYRELVQARPLSMPSTPDAQRQLDTLKEALSRILEGATPQAALGEAQSRATR